MSSAAELKDLGNRSLQNGNYDDAIDYYTTAIDIDPKNYVLYSNRSAAYAKVGQFEEALTDAQECIGLNPEWAKGYTRKAAALEFMHKFDEAANDYDKAVELEPNNASFVESAAKARAKVALNGLNDLVSQDPELKGYLSDSQFVANLNLLKSNPDMLTILMKDPKILHTVSKLFRNPKSMDTEVSNSREKPQNESKLNPEDQNLSDNEREANLKKELGNAAYKKKDFPTAIENYDAAFKLHPKDITFLTNKSAVYFEMADYESCIKTCEQAIDIGRDLRSDYRLIAKALARIGHCYEKQNDLANAKKFYDKSLSEFRAPDIIKKSQALDKKLKEQERLAYVNPAIAEAEKQKGNTAFANGNFPDAIKYYTEAIKRSPDDPKLYSNRAACYTKLMEFACALKDCETCITLDPAFVKGYLRKAACLLAMKDISQARNAYRKVLELDPNCSEARNGLYSCVSTEPDEESARQRAANDPEIQAILCDPAMRMILNQMGEDPSALREHLKNPGIAAKLMKLIDAGIIALR